MAGANDLTTLTNALGWLGIQSDDTIGTVARLITAISTNLQNVIGRNVLSASYTRTFNGKGGQRQMLPDSGPGTPVTAVASVTLLVGAMGSMVIPARVAGTAGYSFDDTTVYVDRPYVFSRGQQNVVIAYTAGATIVPFDLEQACLSWLKATLDSQMWSANVSMAKAGDHQLVFDNVVTKMQSGVIPMPPSIYAMMRTYQRVFPV